MKNKQLQHLTTLAILIALTVAFSFIAKIPTPTGLLTLVDAGIFFTAFNFGKRDGAIVGGLSAFLIDLLSGAPQWMLFSLVIHGLQGYLAGLSGKWRLLGVVAASLIMVGGYALASTYMYGFGSAFLDMIPNLFQNLFGLIIGLVLYRVVKKAPFTKA